ncbi:hypothetical protein evm_007621 [Chilo suppressalis]|nr:hypothetical protein evm_007621 [Chilo suppressalis]
MNMDILVELSIDKWPELQKRVKEKWPLNVAGFYTLDLNMNYPNVRDAFNYKVYCPYGDIDKGFIAISDKDANVDFVLFATTEDTIGLEDALVNTKLINWNDKICVDLVTSSTLNILERVIDRVGFKSARFSSRLHTFFLDKNTEAFDMSEFPSNVYAAPVISNRVQIQRIDSTWPYKHSASDLYFTTLALSDLGYGLYLHGTENLIAWVFINEHSFLCHLYCEEEYRGRGYAEWLMKYVINDQLGKGKDLYTYVENYNAKSSRLFDKLGFDNIDQGAYMLLQK